MPLPAYLSRFAAALVALPLAAAAASAPTQAADVPKKVVEIRVARGAGPSRYDRVRVVKFGSPEARTVVVLVPGWFGGAGSLSFFGRELARLTPDTQVWLFERRQRALADLAQARESDLAGTIEYYSHRKYRAQTAQTAPFARDWGLALTLNDLRRVVLRARDGGKRKVYLGGHSWGAATALNYAAWDFDGQPGYQDVAGLIAIDGGVHDAFAGQGYNFRMTAEQARTRLRQIAEGGPFDGTLTQAFGLGDRPESTAILYFLAGMAARQAPSERSTLSELLPKALQPPTMITNRALLGWIVAARAPVPDLQVRAGHLATSEGLPADWVDDGPVALADVAAAYGDPDLPAWEWYWPKRLSLDLEASDSFAPNEATEVLGLHGLHGAAIDRPLYVFASGLTRGTVTSAAQWVVSQSRISRTSYESDEAMTHLDPLFTAAERNKCLTSLSKFLVESR